MKDLMSLRRDFCIRLNCLIMEYTRNENENVNFNWLHHRKLYIST